MHVLNHIFQLFQVFYLLKHDLNVHWLQYYKIFFILNGFLVAFRFLNKHNLHFRFCDWIPTPYVLFIYSCQVISDFLRKLFHLSFYRFLQNYTFILRKYRLILILMFKRYWEYDKYGTCAWMRVYWLKSEFR